MSPQTATDRVVSSSSQTGVKPHVEQVKRDGEGCLGYIVACPVTKKAVIIDPRLDLADEFLARLKRGGYTLDLVIDTHTHADHLSGAPELKRKTGAAYAMLEGTLVEAANRALRDGEIIHIGEVGLRVITTPGHTPDSISLHTNGHLFTGDTMLIGGAGRCDFMGGDPGSLYDSFQRFSDIPGDTTVWPGHDYQGRSHSTLAAEREHNAIYKLGTRDAVVQRLSQRGPLPANMAEILTFNRKGSASSQMVGAAELSDELSRGPAPLLLDVRSPFEFGGEWIENAWNLPLPELESRMGEVASQGKPVVLVCELGNRALMAAQVLQRRGVKGYRILDGGMAAWRKAKLPVKRGKKRMSIERQVLAIAGSLVLLGVVLGTFVNPWLYGLSAFIGAGLTFAGLSGFCGMGMVLMKMPWNKLPAGAAGPSGGGSCAVGGSAGGSCAVGGGMPSGGGSCAVGGTMAASLDGGPQPGSGSCAAGGGSMAADLGSVK